MRISIIQMCPGQDEASNIAQAQTLIDVASGERPEFVTLSEIESWIAAPATWGELLDAKGEVRTTYGNSMICDPWGLIVAHNPDGTGFASVEIDRVATAKIRRDMPVLEHRANRRAIDFMDLGTSKITNADCAA